MAELKKKEMTTSSAKKGGSSAPGKPTKKKASSAPPWQVLSDKDAKKNIVKEKERRKLAQQGIHQSTQPEAGATLSKHFLDTHQQRLLAWKRFSPSAGYSMTFIGAYLDKRLPVELGAPEVAFLGRSNVGKSSLLNRLVASSTTTNQQQARVGKTPGATASVNLYALWDAKERPLLGLVDLPGFGYAKLSKDTKESVQAAAEYYLEKRKTLAVAILLVDIRRKPSDDDRAVLAALYDLGIPILVVATKVDKVGKGRDEQLELIQNGLGLPEGQPLVVSSVTGEGCKQLWSVLMEACETMVEEKRCKYESGTSEREEDNQVDYTEDDDDLVYDQGYDWVHSIADDGLDFFDESEGYYEDEGGEWVDDFDDYDKDETFMPPVQRETLQDLRKRARDMERRGEV